jgi:protein-S-isoprenylcysteine O-methyltransferase Ste14
VSAPAVPPPPRPRSAVSSGVGIAGLAGIVGWTIAARAYGWDGPGAALAACVACAVPMVLWSLLVDRTHRSPSSGIVWDAAPRTLRQTLPISLVKLAGLWATWAGIAFLYWIGRWYWQGNYLFAMQVTDYFAIPLLALSIPYVLWLDRRLAQPRDGAWHFGLLVVGRRAEADRAAVAEHLRGWAIKGFFLAFMIGALPGNWSVVIRPLAEEITANPVAFAFWLAHTTFMVDVSFATVGYLLTMKPLDAHIRSSNPFAVAWMAALLCYPPFAIAGPGLPIDHFTAAAEWTYWFDGWPLAAAFYCIPLVLLHLVYAWATVAFGPRFSNLTNRGIITHGPYAWTRHPAYLSKNLFWWMTFLPFLSTSGSALDAFRNTVMLLAVNGIYYWRARTEERHLLPDPAYREYSEWMERHGPVTALLRRIGPKAGQFAVRGPAPESFRASNFS